MVMHGDCRVLAMMCVYWGRGQRRGGRSAGKKEQEVKTGGAQARFLISSLSMAFGGTCWGKRQEAQLFGWGTPSPIVARTL